MILAVEVDEVASANKPCFYKPAGLPKGAYVRVGNTNQQMIDYEVFGYLSSRGQPKDDEEVVVDATLSDLDSSIVDDYLHRGKDNDYSEAKGSSCKAAGARGGGREGSPRCSRILRVVSGGRIVAKMQSRPPHKWQAKTSAAKEQFSYCISRSGTDTACYFG